ncbi:hypothetical protein H7F13_09190 [Proteus vulgaris]|uniref:hypothetical protein n=1 Tax=Proteus faecis TaxID=2050967 RepID=UPI00163CA2B3|nr:hypothetical protein [Proteus faecis]MDM3867730.1 hypothetical protein [Proteus faecis]QNH64243.1 hypothetical protein H7F13_09190 [Proteus vulgaris]
MRLDTLYQAFFYCYQKDHNNFALLLFSIKHYNGALANNGYPAGLMDDDFNAIVANAL